MRVVIFEVVIRKILSKSEPNHAEGYLLGRIIDQGDVIQVLNVDLGNAVCFGDYFEDLTTSLKLKKLLEPVGLYIRSKESLTSRKLRLIEDITNNNELTSIASPLILVVEEADAKNKVSTYLFEDHKSLKEVEHTTVAISSKIFERVRGIIDTDILLDKKVAVIGLGTGGSKVAVELAKCGVGTLTLIDYDRIEAHNISRHICGIYDIGRLKTYAVKDAILQHNPLAQVEIYNMDVSKSLMEFERIVSTCDLVIAATGSPAINNLTNEICIKHNIPAIYAAAWEKARAGYVMRVIPRQTACFNCVHEILLKTAPPLDQERVIDYSIITDPNELRAEPGLSIDASLIALLQAKMALLTLVRDKDTDLEDIRQDYLLWLNKSYDRFKPFSCLKIYTKRKNDCAVCNYEKWLEIKTKSLTESS